MYLFGHFDCGLLGLGDFLGIVVCEVGLFVGEEGVVAVDVVD